MENFTPYQILVSHGNGTEEQLEVLSRILSQRETRELRKIITKKHKSMETNEFSFHKNSTNLRENRNPFFLAHTNPQKPLAVGCHPHTKSSWQVLSDKF